MSPTASDALSKQRLRLWLHLLRTTRSIEADLREFLRVAHQTTLPRFDVMAALYRSPEPQTMTELSRHLLVSNGNITTVVDRLVMAGGVTARSREGLESVARLPARLRRALRGHELHDCRGHPRQAHLEIRRDDVGRAGGGVMSVCALRHGDRFHHHRR